MTDTPPVVLVFAGLDPSGGAGLQADIEAIASAGGHAAPVATCLTVQDTQQVHEIVPVDADLINVQARVVLADLPVAALKIGAMASAEVIDAIGGVLAEHPELPVVLDPVLASGSGQAFSTDDMLIALHQQLLPRTTLLTPNSVEARRLCPETSSLADAAAHLLQQGVKQVLITGTHEPGDDVTNTLYARNHQHSFRWPRLAGEYHGSGCTLAARIAAHLAKGESILNAVEHAQKYTHAALSQAYRLTDGQSLPRRCVEH